MTLMDEMRKIAADVDGSLAAMGPRERLQARLRHIVYSLGKIEHELANYIEEAEQQAAVENENIATTEMPSGRVTVTLGEVDPKLCSDKPLRRAEPPPIEVEMRTLHTGLGWTWGCEAGNTVFVASFNEGEDTYAAESYARKAGDRWVVRLSHQLGVKLVPKWHREEPAVKPEPPPVDWDRWHELRDIMDKRKLTSTEEAEYQRFFPIVAQLDAKAARVANVALDELVQAKPEAEKATPEADSRLCRVCGRTFDTHVTGWGRICSSDCADEFIRQRCKNGLDKAAQVD